MSEVKFVNVPDTLKKTLLGSLFDPVTDCGFTFIESTIRYMIGPSKWWLEPFGSHRKPVSASPCALGWF